MAFFFLGNPVLGPLEDRLWEKAWQRYVDEGGSPGKDLKALDRETRSKLRSWVEQWRATEDEKLKPVWKEFKRTISDQVATALYLSFKKSDQGWYAVEKGNLPSFPEIVALPLAVLRRTTERWLPEVLGEKIEFKDMLPETRQALAKYAADRCFTDVLQKARKDHRHFQIDERLDPFVIADVIEGDFYHLDKYETASRIDMVILTTFHQRPTEKDIQKKVGERTAIEAWKGFHRSDSRRFRGDGWGLTKNELSAMARR